MKTMPGTGAVCGLTVAIVFGWPVAATAAMQSTPADVLSGFLQNYVKGRGATGKTGRYRSAFFDLNGDGNPEAIVYLSGSEWCGSGGCTALILASSGTSYKVITRITIVRLPIRVLGSSSNGWRDLGVWVSGGGIQPGYEAKLRFDGKSYPSNPTVSPARHMTGHVPGDVAIGEDGDDLPLYP